MGSFEQSLIALQQGVLDSGDFLWRWAEVHPFYTDLAAEDGIGRPASLAALAQAKLDHAFWEEGTHSILDVERICGPADEDEFGLIRPLVTTEVVWLFGSEFPSVADFESVHQSGFEGPLGELLGPKWTGRSLLIYAAGQPIEVYFWGWSGD